MLKRYPRLTWTTDNKLEELDLIINFPDTQCDFMPSITDTTESIVGVDGAIVIGSNFEPRIFDIYAFTPEYYKADEFREELRDIKRRVEVFMLKAKEDFIELYIEHMRASIYVKLNGTIEMPIEQPNWLQFHFPLVAYDVYFHEASDRLFRARQGLIHIVNSGTVAVKPIFELSGHLVNPTFKLGEITLSYKGTIPDGEVVIVDNELQSVYTETPQGIRKYFNSNWCGIYVQFPVGDTEIIVDQNVIGIKLGVRWRLKTVAFMR